MSDKDFVVGKIEFATVTSGHLPSVAMPSGGFTVVQPKPEPSVPLSAIRALVQKIERLNRWTPNKFAQMSGWVSGEYLLRDEVLEELAAMCPAPPEDR